MASNQTTTSGVASAIAPAVAPAVQEYIVRVPKESKKKHSIMKFAHNAIDFTTCGPTKIERENNLREYKMSHDIDQMPKFGAGSEFGREAREEARRKKYGVNIKRYNPEDQPWLLKAGQNPKTCKKFKGVKEGGVLQNARYYVFTQCVDGAFEAFPVEEWYNFTPMAKYKYLNSEEAEEEFERRDKTMNLFSVMVRKRLRKEIDDDILDGEDGVKSKKGKKSKDSTDFMLTDLDEWAVLDKINDDDDEEEENSDSEKPSIKKGPDPKGKKKKKERNVDLEAEEDEDSVDEGQEVDYMTDTDSDDEDMYSEDVRRKGNEKYEEKGVEDAVASDEEEPVEEEKKEEEEEEEDADKEKDIKAKKNNDSDSELSGSSDSESDPEKEPSLTSPLLMQKGAEKKKTEKSRRGSLSSESSAANSRSATPTKQKKRKLDETDSPGGSKKVKPDPREQTSTPLASEGVTEDAVRRYLMRKPMTIKDLLQKFKNAGLTKERLVAAVVEILKKINPEKKKIHDTLYLSIKKPE